MFKLGFQFAYIVNEFSLSSHPTMNEFLKIDNYRFVLLSTNDGLLTNVLYIIFFDYSTDYLSKKVRYYYYNFNSNKISKFSSEISAFIYNDFLSFTATVMSPESSEFPILLMFGYPNGTDFENDISPYLNDTEKYNASYNLYNYLIQKMEINNNIFGYEKVDQIKLISIPEELIFLNKTDNSPIINNDNINVNHILIQNDSIIKNNSYYYLDYQFMVKEPDYKTLYSSYLNCSVGDSINLSAYYVPKILYGRTNTLKFKLCHKYCKTCRKIGISDNNQKCLSCLDEYSYFSFYNPSSECIPHGYYYDEKSKELVECISGNSKFYVNITTNKSICFNINNDCPTNYENYNQAKGECMYSNTETPTTETIKSIITTEIIEISISDNNINNPETSEAFDIFTTDINTEKPTNKETKPEIDKQSNEEINKKIDTELLMNYTVGEGSLELKGENNTIFQITTTSNELNRFIGNLSNDNWFINNRSGKL